MPRRLLLPLLSVDPDAVDPPDANCGGALGMEVALGAEDELGIAEGTTDNVGIDDMLGIIEGLDEILGMEDIKGGLVVTPAINNGDG